MTTSSVLDIECQMKNISDKYPSKDWSDHTSYKHSSLSVSTKVYLQHVTCQRRDSLEWLVYNTLNIMLPPLSLLESMLAS